MVDCRVWELVKVPSPDTNRPMQQHRPALVVAVLDAPEAPRLLWVLMVTRAANRGWPGDVVVSELDEAGLPAASVVRVPKVATIDASDAERIDCFGEGRLTKIAIASSALRWSRC